jgi:hypothetical protein
MVAESRSAVGVSTSANPTVITGISPPGPQSYVLLALSWAASPASTTGVTAGTGTFVQLDVQSSAGRKVELWLGYNFGTSRPTSVSIARTAAGTALQAYARVIDVLADTSLLPTFSTVKATGTSTAPDPGLITPSVNDIMFVGLVVGAIATPTARASTGNSYLDSVSQAGAVTYQGFVWCEAKAAVPTTSAWTLATSTDWAAIQVKITPPAPPTPTAALLIKGLTTQAADAASAY